MQKITVRIEGEDAFETTLEQFLADNEDGFDSLEIADIKACLARGVTYLGGGGAAVGFELAVSK